MKRKATAIVAFVVILTVAVLPTKVYSINDEYESLEFFLDQALKQTKDADQRTEILNRYLIKALGLVYRQNKELIRLQRQTLDAMQELRDTEKKEMRELEIQLQKSQ
jgi:biopolymer transport protein ExbB/TolQ